jgi:lipopolysaccharide export system protein LptC
MMVADDLQAVIDVEEGNRIVIDATAAKYRDGDGRLLLEGGVNISSSTGYTMRTEGLDASIDTLELESTDRVEAEGPGVTLTAGKLSVTEDNATNDIQLLFTGGVKLIYTPETSEGEE